MATRKYERIALAAIVVLAASLRLGWPGLTEFKGDEARLLALALDLAELKSFPVCGIGSSVAVPNSPVSVYLFAVPLVIPFLRNPIGAVLWVGALNTLAVALCWRVARRYWGTAAGLAAALLFASAPWAVIYSRKIWAQNLLPIFTVAYVGAGLAAFVEGRRKWLAAHIVLLALLIQIHLSALALVPLTGLLLILFRQRLDRRWFVVGLALGAAAFTPYAVCGLTHASAIAPQAMSNLTTQPANLTLESVSLSWMVSTGADIHSLAGPAAFRQFLASVPNLNPLLWLEGALAIGGCLYWIWQAARGRWRGKEEVEAGLVIALWLAAPAIFFLRHATPVFPHYFITLFPGPYLAAGAMIGVVWQRAKVRWLRWLAGLVPLGIAIAQAGLLLVLLKFVGTHATPGGFGVPLRLQLAVARGLASDMAQTGTGEVLFVSDGDSPAIHEAPAVFDVLLRGVPHRFVNGREAAVLPVGGAIVVIAPGDLPARTRYLAWAPQGSEAESFPLRPGEGDYLRLALPAVSAARPPHARTPADILANRVEILGYDWRGQAVPGGSIEWEVWWKVGETSADYHFFNHLVDRSDTRWGQQDGASYPSAYWRPGDRVVNFFNLPVAPEAAAGPYWVRVGMYTYPGLRNVPVLDAAGNPAADAVKLGPLPDP